MHISRVDSFLSVFRRRRRRRRCFVAQNINCVPKNFTLATADGNGLRVVLCDGGGGRWYDGEKVK